MRSADYTAIWRSIVPRSADGLHSLWRLVMTTHWAKVEKPYIIRMAIGASAVISRLMTVISCISPRAMVYVLIIGAIPAYSQLAMEYGWSPEIGYLGHFVGKAFGAFWWLVALQHIPVRQMRTFC